MTIRRGGGGDLAAAFLSESPEATEAMGAALGARLLAGDVVALVGELGSGKTVFAKGVAAGLGIPPHAVTSPTFTLLHIHEGRCRLYHLDLYRLHRQDAVEALGWDEAVSGRGVAVVEWADRAGGWLPPERLDVWMDAAGETARQVVMVARGARPRHSLMALLEAPAWASRRLADGEEAALYRGEDRGGWR